MYTLLDARLSALGLGFYMFLLYLLIKMNKQHNNNNKKKEWDNSLSFHWGRDLVSGIRQVDPNLYHKFQCVVIIHIPRVIVQGYSYYTNQSTTHTYTTNVKRKGHIVGS